MTDLSETATRSSEPEAPPDPDLTPDASSEAWRRILTGNDPILPKLRSFFRRIPSSPRCKFCLAPFKLPGRILTRVVMHGQSTANPLLCNACFGQFRDHPGGAEIELSVLFADVRGSTGLAERQSPAAFRRLLQQFYAVSFAAVDGQNGILDKFLGDGVMALFIPLVTGQDHAGRAVEAGRDLLRRAQRPDLIAGGVGIGAGVHTGQAFVGVLGSGDKLDFSALGDAVNVASRLGSVAGPGELLVSRAAWVAAGLALDGADIRSLEVKGRAEPLDVIAIRERESRAAVA
jgi:adenylate cyclase